MKTITNTLFLAFAWFALLSGVSAATAATFDVEVGAPGRSFPPELYSGFSFAPSSVTIHPGDQVKWTWVSSGHSTMNYLPGGASIWDSGVRNQGATFTHTFNSVGTSPYFCKAHLREASELGKVIVATPTPTPPNGPPTVTTNPATFIASFYARFKGSLNPNHRRGESSASR